jgi:hypothetical protein
MSECVFVKNIRRPNCCKGKLITLFNNIKSIIAQRAEVEGININNGQSHICQHHYNKYYVHWKAEGCIDPQCHQPLIYDKHSLTIVPTRCLPVFFDPISSSLIHHTCLKQFDKRYHTHPKYIPPSNRKRTSITPINNNNNNINNNNNNINNNSYNMQCNNIQSNNTLYTGSHNKENQVCIGIYRDIYGFGRHRILMCHKRPHARLHLPYIIGALEC